MVRWWVLSLSLLGLVLAQDWRLYESRSYTEAGPGPWRYTLSPRTKEARELWQKLSDQYRDHLRAGYRVDLGGWRVYFRGGVLWLAPHCPKADNPACFTFGALPVEKARGRLSPEPVHAPESGMEGSATRSGSTAPDRGRGPRRWG